MSLLAERETAVMELKAQVNDKSKRVHELGAWRHRFGACGLLWIFVLCVCMCHVVRCYSEVVTEWQI